MQVAIISQPAVPKRPSTDDRGCPCAVFEGHLPILLSGHAQMLTDRCCWQADCSNRGYHPYGMGTAKNPYQQLDRKEVGTIRMAHTLSLRLASQLLPTCADRAAFSHEAAAKVLVTVCT